MRARYPLRLVALTTVGLFLVPVGVGIVMAAAGLGGLLRHARIAAGGSDTAARWQGDAGAGALSGGVLVLGMVLGVLFGGAAIEPLEQLLDDDLAVLVTALLSTWVGAVLVSPLALIGLAGSTGRAAHERGSVLVAALGRVCYGGAAGVLVASTALAGLAAMPIVLSAIALVIEEETIVVAFPLGIVLAVALAPPVLGLLARLDTRAEARARDAGSAPAALRGLGTLLVGPSLVLVLATMLVAAWPLPIRLVPSAAPELPGTRLVEQGGLRLASGEYDSRLRVASEDGTRVLRTWPSASGLTMHSVRAEGDGLRVQACSERRIGGPHPWECALLRFDAHGARIGDTVLARIAHRARPPTIIALVIALFLSLALAVLVGRELPRVAQLAAPEASEGAPSDRVRALPVVLRVGSDAVIERGSLVAPGHAVLEARGGAVRIALPPSPLPLLALDPQLATSRLEGTRATLLLAATAPAAIGLRDATVPFPEGAALVLGDRARAAAWLAARAFGWALPLVLGIGGALLLSAVALLQR